ncbi:MAG TPA: succinylglutamate desuccinylase/aspartoacylase family protein [Cyclobacteriaceae bacterium]|nr:succinylglutamate desuccinylase/aspartoacylase family protein [Cyclobacteriaceae bacterium]
MDGCCTMMLNGTRILPGEEKKINISIAKLPSRSALEINITVSRSEHDGPVLLLMGAMHGDEINGTEVVRRLIESQSHRPTRGTTICIPIINIYGFISSSRYVPDGKDVNRSFPGNARGSLASRVAHYLTRNIVPKIDYGIDFHTGGATRVNYPQIRGVLSDPDVTAMAHAFNAPFTIDARYRPASLRQWAARQGKKILVYEGGETGRFDEFAIKEGIDGTLRLMHYLNMRDDAPPAQAPTRIIKHTSWVRAAYSGIFLTRVSPGQAITRGQELGTLNDPYGDFSQPIRSTTSGYVIGLNQNPVVHQGDALMHVGQEVKS